MISYILVATCVGELAYESFRAWRRPTWSLSDLVRPLFTVAVVLLLSRAIVWYEAVPFWVWPALAFLAAATVGLAVYKYAATAPTRSEAAAQTAPR